MFRYRGTEFEKEKLVFRLKSHLDLTLSSNRNGFTLVEVVVVICVLSIFASCGMLLLTNMLKRAEYESKSGELLTVDKWCRLHSQGSRATLRIDLTQQLVSAATQGLPVETMPPLSLNVYRVVVDGAVFDTGIVNIEYHSGGSGTFAVLTKTPARQGKWAIFCGPTGQVQALSNDDSTEKKLVDWLAKWAHAH